MQRTLWRRQHRGVLPLRCTALPTTWLYMEGTCGNLRVAVKHHVSCCTSHAASANDGACRFERICTVQRRLVHIASRVQLLRGTQGVGSLEYMTQVSAACVRFATACNTLAMASLQRDDFVTAYELLKKCEVCRTRGLRSTMTESHYSTFQHTVATNTACRNTRGWAMQRRD